MLRQLDQALSIAREESGAVRGMVSLGLPATTVCALGMPLVQRLRARFPSVLLNVVEELDRCGGRYGVAAVSGAAGVGVATLVERLA